MYCNEQVYRDILVLLD